MFEIEVGNNFEAALRTFEKRIKRSGLMRELKMREAHEKPSSRRRRERITNIRRSRRTEIATELSRSYFAGESRRMTQQFWAAKRKREESLIITKT